MGQAQASDGAGDAGRAWARAMAGQEVALVVEVHAGGGGGGCGLAEVDRDDLAGVGQVGDDEAAAAEVAGGRVGDGQGKGGGDGGVDGVSALPHDVTADFGGVMLPGRRRRGARIPGRGREWSKRQ